MLKKEKVFYTPSYDVSKVEQYAPVRHPDILPNESAARVAYARMLSMDATIYGLVSVFQYREMYRQAINHESSDYVGFNKFVHDRELAKPGYKAFKSPNVDTIYSNAWLNLTDGPLLIETPEFGERYYTLQLLDMYGNTTNISLRTKGPNAGSYLVTTTDWQGELPSGVTQFKVATPYQWILMRIFPLNEFDLPEVHALQESVKIISLTSDVNENKGFPQIGGSFPLAESDGPAGFFKILDFILRSNGKPAQEDALTYRYRALGIGGQIPFDFDTLDPEVQEGMIAGYADAMKVITSSQSQLGIPLSTHWVKTNSKGAYGFNYLSRAAVNYVGLGANVVEENQSFVTFHDENGEPLDGSKGRYVLHMDSPPPADAFWSVTLYDANTKELYPNSINRYCLNDRTTSLQYGPNGSVTITVQHTPPTENTNWLSAPKGAFYLSIRSYMPRPELLEGKWEPEGVRYIGK
ncbi:hypothetical protein BTR23_22565 [Alkalihalophilus pseudofirmus]|nr:hypothetical protein BTR23_22565 [Alkalihalophilus pseudofirmus]